MKKELTAERLRELLDYDPETGVFRWKVPRPPRKVGDVAGHNGGGYVRISIDDQAYKAHRLAWLYVTGAWPVADVDHKDLDKSNNRWDNLRAADSSSNRCNTPRPRNNTSGFKGVCFHKASGKYMASIKIDQRSRYLGIFATPEEAHAAYSAASAALHGEFGRTE